MTTSDLVQLRRGNLLQLLDGRIVRVYNIIDDRIESINTDGIGVTLPSTLAYKPIILTKEWLLKLGFVKHEGSLIYSLEFDKTTGNKIKIDFITLNTWIVSGGKSTKIKSAAYIHQIQNLFWVLSSQELQITEEQKP